jgi:hypothetical protein
MKTKTYCTLCVYHGASKKDCVGAKTQTTVSVKPKEKQIEKFENWFGAMNQNLKPTQIQFSKIAWQLIVGPCSMKIKHKQLFQYTNTSASLTE